MRITAPEKTTVSPGQIGTFTYSVEVRNVGSASAGSVQLVERAGGAGEVGGREIVELLVERVVVVEEARVSLRAAPFDFPGDGMLDERGFHRDVGHGGVKEQGRCHGRGNSRRPCIR